MATSPPCSTDATKPSPTVASPPLRRSPHSWSDMPASHPGVRRSRAWWKEAFVTAGLEADIAETYASTFEENALDATSIDDLSHEMLQSMGIHLAAHRGIILRLREQRHGPPRAAIPPMSPTLLGDTMGPGRSPDHKPLPLKFTRAFPSPLQTRPIAENAPPSPFPTLMLDGSDGRTTSSPIVGPMALASTPPLPLENRPGSAFSSLRKPPTPGPPPPPQSLTPILMPSGVVASRSSEYDPPKTALAYLVHVAETERRSAPNLHFHETTFTRTGGSKGRKRRTEALSSVRDGGDEEPATRRARELDISSTMAIRTTEESEEEDETPQMLSDYVKQMWRLRRQLVLASCQAREFRHSLWSSLDACHALFSDIRKALVQRLSLLERCDRALYEAMTHIEAPRRPLMEQRGVVYSHCPGPGPPPLESLPNEYRPPTPPPILPFTGGGMPVRTRMMPPPFLFHTPLGVVRASARVQSLPSLFPHPSAPLGTTPHEGAETTPSRGGSRGGRRERGGPRRVG